MTFFWLTWVEMRRALHRRLVRWMVVLALALCALAGVIAFLTSGDPIALALDDEHPAYMAHWWIAGSSDGFLTLAALFLVIGAGICGASVAGAEWRAGTVSTALTWAPSRARLHAARTASAAVLAFVIAIGLQVVFLAAALPAVLAHGSTAGTDAAWWGALVLAVVRIAFVTSLVAVLAVNLATLGRNTSAALVVMAGWAIAVERIIAGLRPGLARFMVSENVATFVPWTPIDSADFYRPPLLAFVSLLLYLSVVVGAATWNFARRDIAAAA